MRVLSEFACVRLLVTLAIVYCYNSGSMIINHFILFTQSTFIHYSYHPSRVFLDTFEDLNPTILPDFDKIIFSNLRAVTLPASVIWFCINQCRIGTQDYT